MKKKILFVAAVLVCIAIAAAGTLAYFTSSTTAHNVITSGKIDIELVEKTIEDGVEVDFPEDGISGVMPGTSVDKIVTVKNTGTSDAWIRVALEATIVSASGEPLSVDVMTYGIESGWVLGNDGYYYYTDSVAPGASTSTLIEEVHFAPKMGNEYQNCTANLVVTAQAVQVTHNGETVMEAVGWPESAE